MRATHPKLTKIRARLNLALMNLGAEDGEVKADRDVCGADFERAEEHLAAAVQLCQHMGEEIFDTPDQDTARIDVTSKIVTG